MSYILDALKKSEQARGLRKTLGLLEAPVTSPSLKSVARWPYIIAFAIVLNACFFVFWLRPWQWGGNAGWKSNGISGGQLPEAGRRIDLVGPPAPAPLVHKGEKPGTSEGRPEEKEQSALNPPAPDGAQAVSSVTGKEREGEGSKTEIAGQAADAAVPSKTVDSGTHSEETPPDRAGENKTHAGGAVAKQGQKTEASPAEQAPAQSSSAQPGVSGTTEAATKKPDSSKLPQDPKTVGTKQGPKTAKSQAAVKKPAASVDQPMQSKAGGGIISDLGDLAKLQEASSSKPPAPPAPKWHELAPEIRDAIPSLAVSMLIYSQKPEERWININGSKKREGQEISPGFRLEQITPDGAIFSYKGQRFFKGVVGD